MKTRLLTPSGYLTTPWKNGHGITHEIAAERSAEDVQTGRFVWRLSMAEVAAAAPFSLFPGCDRTLLLLDGDGLVLDRGDAGREVLAARFEPYAFPGEWPIDCQLLGGPCRDFNVMVDRSRARAEVTVVPVRAPSQPLVIASQTAAIFTLTGSLRITVEPHEPTLELPARHTLLLTEDSAPARTLILGAEDPQTLALVVELSRRGD